MSKKENPEYFNILLGEKFRSVKKPKNAKATKRKNNNCLNIRVSMVV